MPKADEEKVKKESEVKAEATLTDIPGIGPGIAAKLEAAGVYDLMGLAVMSPAALSELAGVGEAVARKAIQAARGMMSLGFSDGVEFAKKRADVHYITTGSKNVDTLLGGKGVETRALTEAYGAFGSGKSQLGFTLAVTVQLPQDKGGANGKAVFIDTEGTFRAERIRQIAEGMGAQPEKVLKNILVARAFNSDHQILLMDKVGELIKNGEPIRLIIIDSLTAHFRAEFAGRGQLADRQQKLNRYLHTLTKLAEQHNLAVYLTNQVMANPGMMFGDPTTPVGGNILGHACLTGDSLIQLSDGDIVPIKAMQQQRVISGSFTGLSFGEARSEQLFVNPDIRERYLIKTGNQITCSPLHRFFSVENFAICEKEARDLQEGDFIATAGKIDIEGEERMLPEVRLRRIGMLPRKEAERVANTLRTSGITRKEICKKIGITPRQFRRVLNQEYPTSYEVFDNLQENIGQTQILQILPVFSYKHQNIKMPTHLTPALAQIFGYFWGDGNFELGSLRFRDERREVLEHYGGLFKQTFNIKGHISPVKGKHCFTLNINSRELVELFHALDHTIIHEVAKSKKDVVAAFIRGFFDAEGYVNKKRAFVSVVQSEPEILRYLQMFLLRFGIRSTIKFGIGAKNMNVLRIIARDVPGYLHIGFTASDKQKRLLESVAAVQRTYIKEMMPLQRSDVRNLLESCGLRFSHFIRSRSTDYRWVNRRELKLAFKALMQQEIKDRQVKQKIDFIGKILSGAITFEKIREISVQKNNGELFYDFSVPGNENYIANGFVVHNSTYRMYFRRGKQGSRVAKLIDSPNLPDNETVFYVTGHGIKDEDID